MLLLKVMCSLCGCVVEVCVVLGSMCVVVMLVFSVWCMLVLLVDRKSWVDSGFR